MSKLESLCIAWEFLGGFFTIFNSINFPNCITCDTVTPQKVEDCAWPLPDNVSAYLTLVTSSHPGHHSDSCNALSSQQWPNCWKSMVGSLSDQVEAVAHNSSQPACALMHAIVP